MSVRSQDVAIWVMIFTYDNKKKTFFNDVGIFFLLTQAQT